jgi:hypothetical protein
MYIRGHILPSFCFLSFSPYTVIYSSYLNNCLECLYPHLSSHPYPSPHLCPYSYSQLYSSPYPAIPLSLLLSSPASTLWLISLLLNMNPLQLLHITVLEI